jgi:flavin-dependent dehydrogenase
LKLDAFDVVILGAGVAGCATALSLQAVGISDIVLVEAGSPVRNDWVGESLPPDVSVLLKALNLWDLFRSDDHEPCLGSCAAWGGPNLGYNDFISNASGSGWHIHRQRFDGLFRRAVAARGIPIRVLQRLACAEALPLDGGFRLRLRTNNSEATIITRHVVDATGPRAAFARCVGSRSIRHDLLVFITVTAALAPEAWPSRLTMTETVEDGWWYAARLPGNRLSLAFATDPEISRARRLDRPREWLNALAATRHIGPRLAGTMFGLGPLVVRAVPVSERERPCGARWTAVGDAAATFDPLGSEGIYKALEDGIQAAQVIHASLRRQRDQSADYTARVAENIANHLSLRRHFYALERQWPDSLFWRRRSEETAFSVSRRMKPTRDLRLQRLGSPLEGYRHGGSYGTN